MQSADQAFSTGKSNKSPRKLGCTFALLPIIAIILLGVSIWYSYTSYQFYSTGIKVEGAVVRLEESNSDGSSTYSPVFSYTFEGQQYEYESVNSSYPPTNQVGDVETLLIDPNNPARARQNSFGELWLLPCILCPISFLMVALSIGIPFFVRRA